LVVAPVLGTAVLGYPIFVVVFATFPVGRLTVPGNLQVIEAAVLV